MRKLQRSLLVSAAALVMAGPGTAAAQFSNVYFFGDSLTDAGSYKPALPPGTGLFTTNPGPIWAQVFGANQGFVVTPANQGGTDYAQGGARVTSLPGVPATPPTGSAVPIATQIAQFLGKGPVDPKAFYAVWGGANDIFYQLGLAGAGAATPAQVQAAVGLAAGQLAASVGALQAGGARYITVFNLPDIGRAPAGVASGQAASISALSSLFNTTFIGSLDAGGIQTMRVNTFAFFNEVLANPAAFGFANVTTPACGATPSLVCTSANFVTPSAAQTFLFADGVHPTTAGHAAIAQLVESMIVGPQQMAALAEAPLAAEQANFRALDNRMWSSLNAPRDTRRFQAWAAYDYSNTDLQAGPTNGSGHMNTVVVGLDTKVSDHMLVGAMFGYTNEKGDFGGPGGGYTLRQPVGTVYAGYGDGPWYVGATLGAGNLDYSDITRVIPLGALLRTESSDARGYELTGRILGGYWFTMRDFIHGPYARLAYTKSVVKEFSEKSLDSTALTYDRQSRDQLLWSLGWQVAGNIGGFRPYARATWEIDSKDPDKTISASSASLGGTYSVPTFKPDNSYALFSLGGSTEIGGVTGFIAGSATAGRGDGNYWAVTVGLRMGL